MDKVWTQDSERYRYSERRDLPAFSELLGDPEVTRWLWFAPLTPKAVEAYFGRRLDQQMESVHAGEIPLTAVFTVESCEDEFLGFGAVNSLETSPDGFEVGFQLAHHAWGRGIGTRLGWFLCAYAVEYGAAYRIEGACLEGNTRSAALLQKLGLRLECTRPGYRRKGDVRHTELCFGREVRHMDRDTILRVARRTGIVDL